MGGGLDGRRMAGGGFLRSAAATAAGIAGGALLFQGIESLFGHGGGGILGGQAMTPGLGESVVNNYYGSDAPGGGQDFAQPTGGGGQDYSSDARRRPGLRVGRLGGGQDYGSDQDSGGGDFGGGDNFSC